MTWAQRRPTCGICPWRARLSREETSKGEQSGRASWRRGHFQLVLGGPTEGTSEREQRVLWQGEGRGSAWGRQGCSGVLRGRCSVERMSVQIPSLPLGSLLPSPGERRQAGRQAAGLGSQSDPRAPLAPPHSKPSAQIWGPGSEPRGWGLGGNILLTLHHLRVTPVGPLTFLVSGSTCNILGKWFSSVK